MLRLVRSLVELTPGRTVRPSSDGFFLNAERFEVAAIAERMRVDRNGSVLSLLIIEPAASNKNAESIRELEKWLAGRLRLTDTGGVLRDGRVGLLLPDTPESGAWKVAEEICDRYPAGSDRPNCEVIVYPEREDARRTDRETNSDGDGQQPLVGAGHPTPTNASAGPIRAAVHQSFDEVFIRPMPLWKRAVDVAGASVGLVIATPVIAAAALCVRLTSDGPAFFTQEREGQGGRRFKIYKLRTMRPDAERLKTELLSRNEQDGPAFKMVRDPRVTPVGRVLRVTSLDELPQLWNVLRGEMSLVGPRPLPVDESMACAPWQRRRLHVTPGITCIWQIYGRNVVPFDDWIRMDLDYASRRSPWLDLALVARTGPALLRQPGR